MMIMMLVMGKAVKVTGWLVGGSGGGGGGGGSVMFIWSLCGHALQFSRCVVIVFI